MSLKEMTLILLSLKLLTSLMIVSISSQSSEALTARSRKPQFPMWICFFLCQSAVGSSAWAKILVRFDEMFFSLSQLECATHISCFVQSLVNFLQLDLKYLDDMRLHEI